MRSFLTLLLCIGSKFPPTGVADASQPATVAATGAPLASTGAPAQNWASVTPAASGGGERGGGGGGDGEGAGDSGSADAAADDPRSNLLTAEERAEADALWTSIEEKEHAAARRKVF